MNIDHQRAATRGSLPARGETGPRHTPSLGAAWSRAKRLNDRIEAGWVGDVLAGIAFAAWSAMLIWGAAIAQAVWQ